MANESPDEPIVGTFTPNQVYISQRAPTIRMYYLTEDMLRYTGTLSLLSTLTLAGTMFFLSAWISYSSAADSIQPTEIAHATLQAKASVYVAIAIVFGACFILSSVFAGLNLFKLTRRSTKKDQ